VGLPLASKNIGATDGYGLDKENKYQQILQDA